MVPPSEFTRTIFFTEIQFWNKSFDGDNVKESRKFQGKCTKIRLLTV